MDSYTLEEIECLSEDARIKLLLPVEDLFRELPSVRMPAFYERLSRSGCEIYQSKIKTQFAEGERVRMRDERGQFYALGEVRSYEDGLAIKAIKLFSLE